VYTTMLISLVFKRRVHLVALIQVSSAAFDRIFSDVKLILDITGELGIQDAFEARCMERQHVYDKELSRWQGENAVLKTR
jgi:hypothetical protein